MTLKKKTVESFFFCLILTLLFCVSTSWVNAISVAIIESQSINPGHIMDTQWESAAIAALFTATILPQTALDDTSFFSSSDILIISSGVIPLPENRRAIIQQFLEQKGPVYIQSEYDPNFEPNVTFEQIVTAMGGAFSWQATVIGQLAPVDVLGDMASIPNAVPQILYFWYGCQGNGDTSIETYMKKDNQDLGFIFHPPLDTSYPLITNSDQDWVRTADQPAALLENHLTYFSNQIHYPTPSPTPSCLNHGDVNFSGDLTAGDAQLTFQIAIAAYNPTYEERCAADCTGDGSITAGDAQAVFIAVIGMGNCSDPV